MQISEILTWLRPFETEAQAIYEELATGFAAVPELAGLLQVLARDEAVHTRLLDAAERLLGETGQDGPASIRIDLAARDRTLAPLRALRDEARAGQLSEAEALAGIVAAEFSEWNDIFLYVVLQFREQTPAFQQIAAVMERHRRHIDQYMAKHPSAVGSPQDPQQLPRVWAEQLLVVDDNETLRYVIKEALRQFGQVTTAQNGQEALDLTRQKFFDVIVSDVEMPVLNGLEFWNALEGTVSPDRCRVVFVSADPPPALTRLSAEGRVRVLTKPFELFVLRETVRQVLDETG